MIKILQRKFILTAMIAITVLLVVLLGVINVFNIVSVSHSIDSTLKDIVDSAQMMGGMGRNPFYSIGDDSFDNGEAPENTDNGVDDGVAYFSVTLDEDGNAILLSMDGISSVTQDEAVLMAQSVFESKSVSGSDGEYRYMGYTTIFGSGITYVFMDTGTFKDGVLRVVALSALAGVGCWGLMLLFVSILSKKFIRPIAQNMERQKNFVTDAGHEIKTPIAIIQANAEALELFNGESKWTKNIKEQTGRLSALMTNLLTLSKASENYEKPVMYDVDLAEIVEKNVEMFKDPAALRGVMINYENTCPCMVKGDKDQFARVASLLLDNAVKYAPGMSEIDISISDVSKNMILKITNDCEELPDCEPERLFDRFFRPDSSHNSETGGTGIGLATVRAIMEQYKGNASCVYEDGRISFVMTFLKALK